MEVRSPAKKSEQKYFKVLSLFVDRGRMESLPSSVSSSPLAFLLPSPGGELLLNRPLMITKERSALQGLVGRKVCFPAGGEAARRNRSRRHTKVFSPYYPTLFLRFYTLIRKLIIRDGFFPRREVKTVRARRRRLNRMETRQAVMASPSWHRATLYYLRTMGSDMRRGEKWGEEIEMGLRNRRPETELGGGRR